MLYNKHWEIIIHFTSEVTFFYVCGADEQGTKENENITHIQHIAYREKDTIICVYKLNNKLQTEYIIN